VDAGLFSAMFIALHILLAMINYIQRRKKMHISIRNMFSMMLIAIFLMISASASGQYGRFNGDKKDIDGFNIFVNVAFTLAYRYENQNQFEPDYYKFDYKPDGTQFIAGLGCFWGMSDRLMLKAHLDYNYGNEYRYFDYSGMEYAEYEAFNTINFFFDGIYKLGKKKRFYLLAGAGIHYFFPQERIIETYVRKETVIISPPEKKIFPVLILGGGRFISIHGLDLFIELNYIHVFDLDKDNLGLRFGIFF
jgi:Ca2+/Na+ antiporter